MQKLTDKLIVALDVDSLEKAEHFVDILYPQVKIFKVGSQLFTACGPEAVKMVGEKGAKVFLDLKFYDIPKTVFSGVASGTGLSCKLISIKAEVGNDVRTEAVSWPVFMMTVHIDLQGDRKMLVDAVEGARRKAEELGREKPHVVGVTVLTSNDNKEDTSALVLEKARLAKETGLDGVVCSVQEAAAVRKKFGPNFIIVTPGIRPRGTPANDQKRIATAQEAIDAGADYIVVGRPILEANNPLSALQKILKLSDK